MKTLLVIGIGVGDPDHVTVQAIKAMNRVDVFFVADKGTDSDDLVRIRREICERYATERAHRFVHIEDPKRDRGAADYVQAVQAWRDARLAAWREAVDGQLSHGQTGAFLVWGDPSLYDGTMEIVGEIARGAAIDVEVGPGISSPQVLAARHRVPLNQVGGAVHVTTGRRLARGFPRDADDAVVMLDADRAFDVVADADTEIYWGAYLGTPDEILISGRLSECGDEIARVRAEARERKGWMFDVYLLRRRARS